MSCSCRRTRPSTRVRGIVSCMRLRQRSSVDLPQPDGPMIAVTSFGGTSSVTSRTACVSPKYAFNPNVCTAMTGPLLETAVGDVASLLSSTRAVMPTSEPRARHESRDDADHQHEPDQDCRTRPCLCMPVVIRTVGVDVDLEWQSGDRLRQLQGPELLPEAGEEQWGRLARDARDGDEHPRHDAAECSPQNDL